MREILFVLIAVMLFALASCVPARKFQDCQSMNERLLKENANYKMGQMQMQNRFDSLTKAFAKVRDERNDLLTDTTKFGQDRRREQDLNKELNSLYEQVVKQNKELLTNATNTSQKLTQDLEEEKRQLDAKEKVLADQQTKMDAQHKQIDQMSADIKDREKKVNDLESVIRAKDSATATLKAKINEALVDFNKGDLDVYEKDGLIYVSMSEKLLFKSGSYAVDPKGKDALKKVAGVLDKMQDVTVRVEGHTDNQPLAGTGFMKDNWDLSVLRATSISRLLQDDGLDPKRIIASGHGEFYPVADNSTPEGRAKNRRTEIILTPNLTAVYKIINGK